MKKAGQVKSEGISKLIHPDVADAVRLLQRHPPYGLKHIQSKLKPSMKLDLVVRTMSEGLRDARMLCDKILKMGRSIDSNDRLVGVKALVLLDAAGIRGKKIETLYRACGRMHPENLFALVLAVHRSVKIPCGDGRQTRVLQVRDLQNMADPTKITGGRFSLAEGPEIQLVDVIDAVKREFWNLPTHNLNLTRRQKSQLSQPVRPQAKSDSQPNQH